MYTYKHTYIYVHTYVIHVRKHASSMRTHNSVVYVSTSRISKQDSYDAIVNISYMSQYRI